MKNRDEWTRPREFIFQRAILIVSIRKHLNANRNLTKQNFSPLASTGFVIGEESVPQREYVLLMGNDHPLSPVKIERTQEGDQIARN